MSKNHVTLASNEKIVRVIQPRPGRFIPVSKGERAEYGPDGSILVIRKEPRKPLRLTLPRWLR